MREQRKQMEREHQQPELIDVGEALFSRLLAKDHVPDEATAGRVTGMMLEEMIKGDTADFSRLVLDILSRDDAWGALEF